MIAAQGGCGGGGIGGSGILGMGACVCCLPLLSCSWLRGLEVSGTVLLDRTKLSRKLGGLGGGREAARFVFLFLCNLCLQKAQHMWRGRWR